MTQELRIALAGLGTVGTGVVRLLEENADEIRARAGRDIRITAVSARDRTRDRGIDIASYAWEDEMAQLAARSDVDVVVELVGGSDGPALALARGALEGGKHLVTANKAMIAHHGAELAAQAEQAGVSLQFEAAVAGGIPVLKGLREGAAANRVERVYGILNGTSNYILSAMEKTGRDFTDILADAQELGYAEADPTFDIEGVDAAHKLAILAAIAFGTRPDFGAVETGGISGVRAADIAQADALGYVIRLIGMTDCAAGEDGKPRLFQRVQPYLVPKSHPLAAVDGPTNAVVVEGNFAGRLLFQGAGAGDGPTASAVVADLVDIARGNPAAPFGLPVASLASSSPADTAERRNRAYLRFVVSDRPGVMAELTAAMRDAGVSIESLIQHGKPEEAGDVLVAIVTHEGPERTVSDALAALAQSDCIAEPPLVLRVLG
ncbi:homoserine dehydrogenase [Paraurantiacibacter namhicola]|uniref:Homoserine dehydrogenase n=1 Tax=Paraurantiacibacter namhicola TaxID=645517 RepID=A0A1C7D594_9SPHN|nr:homoserine dehydrogenase [Paraurantiacibacter namhicola]ANU06630.1 Homoserine dehydrogenase [Paraurantiacibacter namhicola]